MTLEELVGQDYTLIGKGRYIRALEHNSLVIDTEEQVFYWNSKQIFGGIYDWLTKIKGISHAEAKKYKVDRPASIFDRATENKAVSDIVVLPELVETFYNLGKNYREYWYDKRGYTDRTIENFRLGYTGNGWYSIPIYVDGLFRNFQCRRADSKVMRPWYRDLGALPFNFAMLNICSTVVLTEGPVDAIMLRQYDIPAVSQTSGAGALAVYRQYYSRFLGLDKIYICYDNDVAGNEGAFRLARLFGDKAVVYNLWDFDKGYDITDFFKAGHTAEEFMGLMNGKGKRFYEWTLDI